MMIVDAVAIKRIEPWSRGDILAAILGPFDVGLIAQDMRGRAVGETSADLVGSERVRRHPHRRARSGPLSGVSCGPRACRVRVPISFGRFGYSTSVGGAEGISVIA